MFDAVAYVHVQYGWSRSPDLLLEKPGQVCERVCIRSAVSCVRAGRSAWESVPGISGE